MIVPDRAGPVFAATVNATVPLPGPVGPGVILIQGAFATAVHTHPSPVVTLTEPVPATSASATLVGEIEKLQTGAAADCVAVKVWPPIVIVPLRAAPGFVLTVKATLPLPVPELPLEIAIQLAFDVAVHEQPLSVDVTVTAPVPP